MVPLLFLFAHFCRRIAMAKVRMILVAEGFSAEKWFEYSGRPIEGCREFIRLRPDGGHAIVRIRWVKHIM
jgi:hypothetical protein